MRQLATRAAFAAIFLALLAIAHGDDESISMDIRMSMDMHETPNASSSTSLISPNIPCDGYFACGKHSSTIMAHIALMVLSWCLVLPPAVMLSIVRSRLALPSQFLFLVLNAFGLVLGAIYNTQTPDLYENNAHHKIGWIATWVISTQVILALIFLYAGRGMPKSQSTSFERAAFLPVTTNEHESACPTGAMHGYGWSRDSGQGTDLGSSIHSLGSPSCISQDELECFEMPEESPMPSGLRGWFHSSVVDRFLSKHVPGMASNRVLRIFNGAYNVIDRIILPFGCVAILTGAVTYGGIFRDKDIFNGLAHFIKGGIFFWYGILTLGRFIGAWADLGWAWNKKPPASVVGWKARVPSGEFVESFVIWLYGITNVFLEHLSNSGGAWSAADMEHVSISVMFFGGGLVGMLLESQRIRDALNSTLFRFPSHDSRDENWQPPRSQGVPLNPMPALIILLLGTMMGSHHQDSMTSTMVHKQWGNLLVGFALARGMTYVLLFLRPPSSYLPSRPPTEIVSGFCLIAGGVVFMLSTRNVIETMEFYKLDAMFTFTVAMGFTAFVMCLVILNIVLKAWAVKSEQQPQLNGSFVLESQVTSS
ncbi:hypothetical protein N7448_004462 [Penicillium atrosanguineum]|uniref:Integral membrane protein n=1 Tax=Penicillium atrosanguineum TaxID=1132637 RepID=A0A9W9U1E2_9EURO|nr:hypothetical protein N7526_007312 [Penicillium atrosanguineum]KAJ5135908.1 hypothetical protein N7448_004462 [Penicillium atrosanguineum]KAJ5303718.1 hypothetical protein N7476_010517 [Penicillium atrosanguineum]